MIVFLNHMIDENGKARPFELVAFFPGKYMMEVTENRPNVLMVDETYKMPEDYLAKENPLYQQLAYTDIQVFSELEFAQKAAEYWGAKVEQFEWEIYRGSLDTAPAPIGFKAVSEEEEDED